MIDIKRRKAKQKSKRSKHKHYNLKKGHQIGKSNTRRDMTRHAKKPGKRKSKHNKTYYEHRRNRSDRGRWL